MSPNDDVQEELPLVEGEVVKVFEVDEDGFARGENAAGRTGWMPSNFLEEMPEDSVAATGTAAVSDRVQSLLAQQQATEAVAQEAVSVPDTNANNVRYYQVRDPSLKFSLPLLACSFFILLLWAVRD
jgi:hypothetical protein